ncbi:MAG: hypothetical protein HZA52_16625 [Planctomycetes bacterium]|nr:hypothetical protein [Planctomycetota bacterium]
MKPTRFVRPFVLFLACITFVFVAARAESQSELDEFRAKLVELIKVDDKEAIAKLVKSNQDEAEQHVAMLCWGTRPLSGDQKKQIAALDVAWQTTFAKSNFVNKMYGFYSQLGTNSWKEWAPAKAKLDEALALFDENLKGTRDPAVWDDLASRGEALAKDFDSVGDHYYSARAWSLAALVLDDIYRDKAKGGIDYSRAAKAYDEARRHYLYVEFNGPRYDQVKARAAALAPKESDPKPKAGGGDAGKGGEGGEAGKGGEGGEAGDGGGQGGGEAAAPVVVGVSIPMTFQMVEKLDAFERPHFMFDDIYQLWRPIQFGENGSVQTLKDISTVTPSPKFRRVTGAQYEIDAELDGNFEQPVSITGNRQPVTFTVGTGDTARPWGFLFTIGLEKDIYQGLQVHLGPADKQLSIYTCAAASVVGKFGETQLRVLDDNFNAVYGDGPQLWPYWGMSDGATQPEMDSIVVGAEKRARPWSEYVNLGGKWHQLAIEKFGTVLKVAPAEVTTGTVKLDFKGPVWPSWLVLKGSGTYENSYIDIAAEGKKGVAVPAGEWSLFFGELRKGSKQQTMKCLILPPATPMSWTVVAGKEAVVKLGEPFRFDFKFDNLGESVNVIGPSVGVLGKEGERYERLWNCVVTPECEWRKAGAKKGSKPEKMLHVIDPLAKDVFTLLWKPLDLAMATKEKVDKVEVHLFEKKNKFLGAIDSPWKGE